MSKKQLREYQRGQEFKETYKPLVPPFWLFFLSCLLLAVWCYLVYLSFVKPAFAVRALFQWLAPLMPIGFTLPCPILLFLLNFRYRFESITATHEGLTIQNRNVSQTIPWNRLQDIEPTPHGTRFQTPYGIWEVGRWFDRWHLFEICKRYTPHIDVERMRDAPSSALITQSGALFFSRQTQTNRSILKMVNALTIGF